MLFIHLLVSFFILLSIHVVVRLSGFCLCNLFNLFMEVETCVDVDVPVHSQLVNVIRFVFVCVSSLARVDCG